TLGLYDREATIGMDARAFEGNFLFSLGPNNEAGGSRTTTCHIDIPLRHCDVFLDGEAVVRDGVVLDRWGKHMSTDLSTYQRQSFGTRREPRAPGGLLIIDFVNGFADPDVFGGGNIAQAIENTVPLLAHARSRGWPVAHTRIVFADDDADQNIFALKVPGLL